MDRSVKHAYIVPHDPRPAEDWFDDTPAANYTPEDDFETYQHNDSEDWAPAAGDDSSATDDTDELLQDATAAFASLPYAQRVEDFLATEAESAADDRPNEQETSSMSTLLSQQCEQMAAFAEGTSLHAAVPQGYEPKDSSAATAARPVEQHEYGRHPSISAESDPEDDLEAILIPKVPFPLSEATHPSMGPIADSCLTSLTSNPNGSQDPVSKFQQPVPCEEVKSGKQALKVVTNYLPEAAYGLHAPYKATSTLMESANVLGLANSGLIRIQIAHAAVDAAAFHGLSMEILQILIMMAALHSISMGFFGNTTWDPGGILVTEAYTQATRHHFA